ncbi:CDP-alcohol phosphatidyltransferase family protein, partial [Diaphorobacter nitroreducens]|uniref:CDP-alcohol phosphatidyltransferase family protein n=1 Tax=Diaphorobacter nitroreducens TaxID=164759 RepID=UPI0035E3E2D0
MLREFHLADFFTLGNAACGVGAVFLAMLYMASGDTTHFFIAAALAPAAFAFDVLDGRITDRKFNRMRPSMARVLGL